MIALAGSILRLKIEYGTVSSDERASCDGAGPPSLSPLHQVSFIYFTHSYTMPRQPANPSFTCTAKRLPYCDHIVALDSTGKIVEQGTYDKLNRTGGYVSSFDLPPPDWDFMPEKHVYEAPPKYTERATTDKVTEDDIQAEANRRTGDAAIYLYYVRSVGWMPTIIFIVSITIFIFGQLFPSKSHLASSQLLRYPIAVASTHSFMRMAILHHLLFLLIHVHVLTRPF